MAENLLEELVEGLRCLPGVGRKSAQRMALYLLERNRRGGEKLAQVLSDAMSRIEHCKQCKNFTESELCEICSNYKRDASLICVVESPADVLAIENSGAFEGHYFVLMGQLSPLDGIGPEELGLDTFETRLQSQQIREVILATSSTIEGEATAHYLRELIEKYQIPVTRIAQGVPIGGELEYIDSGTLARSINERRKIEY
ncbi:recombination mediator RecR [Pleionea litopenaei]|uniref:Recombination protein RecR n=1 Tax=Pleionea litopenaei TaxID=3070815 RepID=A0AA51X7S7_9GAMM|nr:recombination mediator RecR [Pleionea sp. HL-JVS1]WMS88181.1 recombination mediator RecR [Pleionea sp. HL-JVS1]